MTTLLLALIAAAVIFGVIAAGMAYARFSRTAAQTTNKAPLPEADASTEPVFRTSPMAPEQEDDDGDITFKTLAISGNRPFLKQVAGPRRAKDTFFLSATGVTTIGRAHDNEIVLAEDAASSHHCRIEQQDKTYTLIDLGSTNKTWVNGVEKAQVVLRNGDQVKIGDSTFAFALFGDRA